MGISTGHSARTDPIRSLLQRKTFAGTTVTQRWMLGVADLIAAALVVTSGAIHLHLWLSTYYRSIPTIGPLFLAQAIVAFLLAISVLALRNVLSLVATAGFLAGTIAGLIISVKVGLFGFQDTLSAPFAHISLVVEAAGIVVSLVAIALRYNYRSSAQSEA